MKRIKILARKNLNMSPGKLAAQSVHAALALAMQEDIDPMMSVVVLLVNTTPFDKAKTEHSVVAVVRDAGFTEVAPGTETCIAFLEDDPRNSPPPLNVIEQMFSELMPEVEFVDVTPKE